ncbi:Anaphase-promoting complex subunit [Thalictrum thalictroides]|uniref:Anaphase-promoting complex subunit n=1 Tax=Thalictrum thalictroides TaxID=46969 RepID=A0A7J6W8L6_THATH|nr:Anaphase-promoting complex subunit [Thalictrum thalictroides]
MQHSLWLIEKSYSTFEFSNANSREAVPPGVLPKQSSLRRIWQPVLFALTIENIGFGLVFLATDYDGVSVLCFLLQEQKGLLSLLRLQTIETNSDALSDIKPDMSWCIPAIAAAPVIVTRPRMKVGLLQFTDVIVLGLENNLLLYIGVRWFAGPGRMEDSIFYSLLSGAERTGRKLSSGVYCKIARGSSHTSEETTVLAMVVEGFGLRQLDLLPAGVSLPLRHALDKCRELPPTDWPAGAYVLIGREDLALSCFERSSKSKELEVHNTTGLISISSPYMQHLHPMMIPSSISDTIGTEGVKIEDTDALDGSMVDGMEHIFNSSTQLRYGRDLRLNEVRRLLCSARPVSVQTSSNPSASDQELQQAIMVPKLVVVGCLPAQQNATVNLDPNIRNIQELRSWPEIHNAVAAGLRLTPLQGKVSRTWITYNKPGVPNVTHAGLLLALGLHGNLRVLTISDIYKYFSQEHESTSVGLMLGLAASYRGTMEPAISKSLPISYAFSSESFCFITFAIFLQPLYFHVPSHHPSSFPELELPTLLQSAALVAIGILYEGSTHPQTMQLLLVFHLP